METGILGRERREVIGTLKMSSELIVLQIQWEISPRPTPNNRLPG